VSNRTTRKPTGLPPWPTVLLAGAEKAGKTYAALAASGSRYVSRTLYVPVGEDEPDEYGALDGANFEIVEHDGTFADLVDAVKWSAEQPGHNGKQSLLIIDSATRLWQQLSAMAQAEADDRARRKAAKYHRPAPTEEADIGFDLWNRAGKRYADFMDAVKSHRGPVILTARLERQTIMDAEGKPTREKDYKVVGHKNLPFDVDAIVMMPERGTYWLSGVRSLKWDWRSEREQFPNFTVERLWERLGVTDQAGTRRTAAFVTDADTSEDAPEPPASLSDAVSESRKVFDEIAGLQSADECRDFWNDLKGTPALTATVKAAIEARVAELNTAHVAEAFDATRQEELTA